MAAPTNMFAPFASNVNKNSVGVNFLTTKVVDAIQNNWVYEQIVQVIQAQPDGINEKGKFTPKRVKSTNLFVEALLGISVVFTRSDEKNVFFCFCTVIIIKYFIGILLPELFINLPEHFWSIER